MRNGPWYSHSPLCHIIHFRKQNLMYNLSTKVPSQVGVGLISKLPETIK